MSKLNFKWRPNLFDLIIVLIGAAAVCVLYFVMRPSASSVSQGETNTLRYTVELNKLPLGASDYIEVGEMLLDSVKNSELGTVISVESEPSTISVTDQVNGVIRQGEITGYEDVILTIETPVVVHENKVTTTAEYQLLVGKSVSVRSKSVVGSGYILSVDRVEED